MGEGIVSLGPAGGFADAVERAGRIVARLVDEARAAIDALRGR